MRIFTIEHRKKLSLAKKGYIPWNKGKKLSKEHREKCSKALKGKNRKEKNGSWKGGITEESRNDIRYQKWRLEVFSKDNFTCQKCLVRGGNLNAHHIENFSNIKKLRFEVSNGITFCKECHKEFHIKYGIKSNNLNQVLEFIKQNVTTTNKSIKNSKSAP